jgi:hypothetical protein
MRILHRLADQALLILLGFLERRQLDETAYVQRLRHWQSVGLTEVHGPIPPPNSITPFATGASDQLVRTRSRSLRQLTSPKTTWVLSPDGATDPYGEALR